MNEIEYKICKDTIDELVICIYANHKLIGKVTIPNDNKTLMISESRNELSNGVEDLNIEYAKLLLKYCKENSKSIISIENDNYKYVNNLLKEAGFVEDSDTIYYLKDNDGYTSEYKKLYVLENYLFKGKEYFLDVFRQCIESDPFIDLKTIDIEEKYNEIVKLSGNQTEYWKLVYQDTKIIGLILPSKSPKNSDGIILYLGVIPNERRTSNKHGTKLHSLALDILFNDIKVKGYLGVTHKDNNGMKKIFEINDCMIGKKLISFSP